MRPLEEMAGRRECSGEAKNHQRLLRWPPSTRLTAEHQRGGGTDEAKEGGRLLGRGHIVRTLREKAPVAHCCWIGIRRREVVS